MEFIVCFYCIRLHMILIICQTKKVSVLKNICLIVDWTDKLGKLKEKY